MAGKKDRDFGRRASAFLFLGLIVVLLLHGCASRIGYRPDERWIGYTESGKASYYAMKFQFRATASGERFNNFALTGAHRKLPFGSRVLVTNRSNGRQVVVRINDRGPHVKGRIIDLTRTAFAKIADVDRGVADVDIKVIR
ncbi:MAG TPA: septal ring lytic transglycosylase RlpA family protein [Desulfobacteraceae bacterium]|nr:septal ring lytic transglycosylase RlpA family protein [Desulfobacteraceae bacterium]